MATPGDVFFSDMPYPDGNTWVSKERPLLVLAVYGSATSQVAVMCMITSSPRRVANAGPNDVLVNDFTAAGLTKVSVIRPQRILTLDSQALGRRVGAVSPAALAQAQTVAKNFINSVM